MKSRREKIWEWRTNPTPIYSSKGPNHHFISTVESHRIQRSRPS